MDTNTLFLIAQKARDLQNDYLCGVKITDKTPKEKMLCPCGAAIQWGRHEYGYCPKNCGHEFIVCPKFPDAIVGGDEADEMSQVVYCRRHVNGHDWRIGELVGCRTRKIVIAGKKKSVTYTVPDIPVDSIYFDVLDDVDALYMVIGVDISGDRVAISPMVNGELAGSTNPDLAADIAAGVPLHWQQPFWVPIEYLETRSEWPFIEE